MHLFNLMGADYIKISWILLVQFHIEKVGSRIHIWWHVGSHFWNPLFYSVIVYEIKILSSWCFSCFYTFTGMSFHFFKTSYFWTGIWCSFIYSQNLQITLVLLNFRVVRLWTGSFSLMNLTFLISFNFWSVPVLSLPF